MLTAVEGTAMSVLLLEPNIALRRAIAEVLVSEQYVVVSCASLGEVLLRADGAPHIALIAWQSMEGLLADEHRANLSQLTSRVRVVLMVPRRWRRLLDESEYGFAGLVSKPFDADELLESLRLAIAREPAQKLSS
jgi:DNA-binding response OmpR family regulator